jgi:Aldehyde dehydrogenase family
MVPSRSRLPKLVKEMPMTQHFANLIAGEAVSAAHATANINPSNTKDVIGEFAAGGKADADHAVAAAKAAFPAWSRSTPQERYDILKKASDEVFDRKDELGRILAREEGKTLPEGVGEAARAVLRVRAPWTIFSRCRKPAFACGGMRRAAHVHCTVLSAPVRRAACERPTQRDFPAWRVQ